MYVCLYHYRHPTGKREFRAHPILALDLEQADKMGLEIAAHYKTQAFIVEFTPPLIAPKLELVANGNDNSAAGSILSRQTEGEGTA